MGTTTDSLIYKNITVTDTSDYGDELLEYYREEMDKQLVMEFQEEILGLPSLMAHYTY